MQEGLVLVHPYDDPLIIAGQGTLGIEIIEQLPEVGTVVIPTGGGGLLAGSAIALKTSLPLSYYNRGTYYMAAKNYNAAKADLDDLLAFGGGALARRQPLAVGRNRDVPRLHLFGCRRASHAVFAALLGVCPWAKVANRHEDGDRAAC